MHHRVSLNAVPYAKHVLNMLQFGPTGFIRLADISFGKSPQVRQVYLRRHGNTPKRF